MDDKRIVKLNDVADITKLAGFEFTKYMKYVDDGNIVAIRALNLKDGALVLDDIKKIYSSVSEALPRSQLHIHDIVISYTGTIGQCAQIREEKKFHLAPNVAKITPKKDLIDPDYLFQYIRSDTFRQLMMSYCHGSTQPTIPMNTIRELPVPILSIDIERRIASILKSIDEKIETNNKINRNLSEQALSIYESIIDDSDCCKIKLGDALEVLKDGTHNPPKRIEIGVPLITGQTLENGFISYEKMTYISQTDYEKIHNKYQPIEKDLIITKIGTVGKVAILRACDIPIAVHCNSALLRFKSDVISQEWGFWLLQSKAFKEEFERRISKTVQDFVSLGQMADITILVPNEEVLKKYDGIFKSYLMQLSEINFENAKLVQVRDSILPRLMSGELDISELRI